MAGDNNNSSSGVSTSSGNKMHNIHPLSEILEDDVLLKKLYSLGFHSPADLLRYTQLQLIHMLDLHADKVAEIIAMVLDKLTPCYMTAGDLLAEEGGQSFIKTGLPTIDKAMWGGWPVGMITELVGPSGVGKTQTCLTAAAACCLPISKGGMGEDAGVIYIDTEKKFTAERLREIARFRIPEYYGELAPNGAGAGEANLDRMLERVTVYAVDTSSELLDLLRTLGRLMMEENKRLLVLDSVAALVRNEFSSAEMYERQEMLVDQAATLKLLADRCKAVVLVTNQVTTRARQDTTPGLGVGEIVNQGGSSLAVVPALGNTWHHCVSNRLTLQQHEGYREMAITKSPLAPLVSCYYTVQASGLVETAKS